MTRELTPAQQMMVDDGMPANFFLSPEERQAAWKGVRCKPTAEMKFGKPAKKDEDPGTAAVRKQVAEAEAAKKKAKLQSLLDWQAEQKAARTWGCVSTPTPTLAERARWADTVARKSKEDEAAANPIQPQETPMIAYKTNAPLPDHGDWAAADAGPPPKKPATASKIQRETASSRKEPGSKPARSGKTLPKKPDLKATTSGSAGKPKTKMQMVDDMLTSKVGATRKQMSEASGWPHVNLRTQANRRSDHILIVNDKSERYRLVPKGVDLEAGWSKVKL
jgi:hypothetical protein